VHGLYWQQFVPAAHWLTEGPKQPECEPEGQVPASPKSLQKLGHSMGGCAICCANRIRKCVFGGAPRPCQNHASFTLESSHPPAKKSIRIDRSP